MRSSKRLMWAQGWLAIAGFLFLWGCQGKRSETECVDPATQGSTEKGTKVTQTPLRMKEPDPDKIDRDWCRTCVMGPKGWASCQVVFAEKDDETRESVKMRSREKACLDSGFPQGECPDKAVVAVSCKGDKTEEVKGDPAKALQQVFFGKQKEAKGDSKDKAETTPKGGETK